MKEDEFKAWLRKNVASSKDQQDEMDNDLRELEEEIDSLRENDPILVQKMEAVLAAGKDLVQYIEKLNAIN